MENVSSVTMVACTYGVKTPPLVAIRDAIVVSTTTPSTVAVGSTSILILGGVPNLSLLSLVPIFMGHHIGGFPQFPQPFNLLFPHI